MKINRKHLILGSVGLLAVSMMSFASAKKSQAAEVFEKMLLKISDVKRFDINWKRIRLYVDLTLQNVTAQDFNFSTAGLLQGKVYRVYRGNELLVAGTLNNISGVNLPAGGFFSFRDILVELPVSAILKILVEKAGGVGNLISPSLALKSLKATDWLAFGRTLRYEVDIEGFGNIFTFKGNVEI